MLSKLYMSCHPEPDSHIGDKIKVALDLSNYTTDKTEHATKINTTGLATKKDFTSLKAEVDKLGINKMINVQTSLNNSKTNKSILFRCW